MLASTSFILVIVVLGLPMWWHTTKVSRVPLPYDGIRALAAEPIRVRCTVSVYTVLPERSQLLIDELRAQFADRQLLNVDLVQLQLGGADATQARTPADLERLLLRDRPQQPGDFLFMEWPQLSGNDVLVTADRTALIASDACK